MERDEEQAGMDAAPEGAAEEARPDSEDADTERALSDPEQIADPDAEQQDPESGPASEND